MKMRIFLSILIGICMIPFYISLHVNPALATRYQRSALQPPPLPPDTRETIAIIQMEKTYSEQQIKQLLAFYPELELRYIYNEAFDGFSVKGTPSAIEKLKKDHSIISASPVKEYHAEMEENVKIIGGDEARGIFDEKNNRLTGKGVKVGVIDTGIDYTHPDLRRNYGGGHDIIDGDQDPMETKSSSDSAKATIHGTHVAGIIAGNGKIQGVAPDATIIAYRALGPGGAGSTEQVLAAIEQAIKDKVDILNLSLGNDINGPDLPISTALNRAVDKGIVAVAAAGNSGPNVWTVGSPGTASKAISVGASTPTMEVPCLLVGGGGETMRVNPMSGSLEWSFDRPVGIALAGTGRKNEMKDVKGKIALIKRGGATFSEKVKLAQESGAIAVLIYNNTSGSFIGGLEHSASIPVGSLSKADGEFFKKNGSQIVRIKIIEEKDQLADFSSRGPVTGSWEMKPDVVAPGVSIHSTVPGGYVSLQGTSMAAPHVAGACAVLKQAHPDWTPIQMKAALMNTAQPLQKDKNIYRTYEQGAGRIQIAQALKAKSLVMPSSIHFGKFQSSDRDNRHISSLTVENISDKPQNYSFQLPHPVEGLSWRFPLSFTLDPKEKKEVKIELTVEPAHFTRKIQDGYLILQAGTAPIHIPYLYVLEEPDYPRVMGFDFGEGDKPGSYRYEVYLPGGADEFGIALFHESDYRFAGFLDAGRNMNRGFIRKEVSTEKLPPDGTYLAKVFAKKANKEDSFETFVTILKKK